eukprot:TRINITY_DN38126_c0_g1_i2.p1 TRINITY_DN38126_c0_g1~~TRINITY_DN38126_c0_g1_i2.p1  ORF type:complete len:171 (+),score=36.72 TRINITY_DN38126_c0_g1_i2:82-594(+)
MANAFARISFLLVSIPLFLWAGIGRVGAAHAGTDSSCTEGTATNQYEDIGAFVQTKMTKAQRQEEVTLSGDMPALIQQEHRRDKATLQEMPPTCGSAGQEETDWWHCCNQYTGPAGDFSGKEACNRQPKCIWYDKGCELMAIQDECCGRSEASQVIKDRMVQDDWDFAYG